MKVLWAIDPFAASTKAHTTLHGWIRLLSNGKADTDVAYVASPAEAHLSTAFDVLPADRYSKLPLQQIKKALASVKVKIAPKKIHVLPEMRLSLSAAAEQLTSFAARKGVEFIALNTHSRKGIERLIIGSFAETIIHKSTSSLLVLNPATKLPKTVKTIVYGADFESEKDTGLSEAIALARRTGAKLFVLHCAGPMYEWQDNPKEPAIAEFKRNVHHHALAAARAARLAGVTCEVMIDAHLEETSGAILKFAAKKKADILVLKAKTGRFQALLGGSTTRKVLREAKQAVYVVKV